MGAKLAERVPAQTVVGSMNRGTNTAALVGVARETLYATTDSAGLSWAAFRRSKLSSTSHFCLHMWHVSNNLFTNVCHFNNYQNCMSSLLPPVCGKKWANIDTHIQAENLQRKRLTAKSMLSYSGKGRHLTNYDYAKLKWNFDENLRHKNKRAQ
ncbi:unnamed protein product [Ceratitis capitata]|uniref:(Mediterranean fruit fly) hypothetical protein n=1 Tax=Ceratitis capitata TaxID=7213 RepID=A0A811VK67_CERCA|nr:unnamed protein product [Ceratitis capitata]